MLKKIMPKNILMLKEDRNGGSKLHRLVTVVGVWALTYAFVKESSRNTMEWLDYMGYAIGMTIMYAPSVAVKLIRALKGEQAEPEDLTQVQETEIQKTETKK